MWNANVGESNEVYFDTKPSSGSSQEDLPLSLMEVKLILYADAQDVGG